MDMVRHRVLAYENPSTFGDFFRHDAEELTFESRGDGRLAIMSTPCEVVIQLVVDMGHGTLAIDHGLKSAPSH